MHPLLDLAFGAGGFMWPIQRTSTMSVCDYLGLSVVPNHPPTPNNTPSTRIMWRLQRGQSCRFSGAHLWSARGVRLQKVNTEEKRGGGNDKEWNGKNPGSGMYEMRDGVHIRGFRMLDLVLESGCVLTRY